MDEETVDSRNDELVRAYRLAFGSPAGLRVMQDLAKFCRAAQTTVEPDTPILLLEGRRQVWLVIQNYMNLTPQEIVQLARGQAIRLGESNA